jgi:hypothetical protein
MSWIGITGLLRRAGLAKGYMEGNTAFGYGKWRGRIRGLTQGTGHRQLSIAKDNGAVTGFLRVKQGLCQKPTNLFFAESD